MKISRGLRVFTDHPESATRREGEAPAEPRTPKNRSPTRLGRSLALPKHALSFPEDQ